MMYILPLLTAFVLSLIFTPIVRRIAIKTGAVDVPKDNRRMHNKPIPSIGGLAIYFAVIISVLLWAETLNREVIAIILGATVIVISGLIDDIKGLSPKKKIVFQFIASIILIIGGVQINFLTNPFGQVGSVWDLGLLSYPITIVWVVGITNAVNLIDGLDGLAAGVSAIASMCLAIIAFNFNYTLVGVISLIVSGSCLGFLPYNFNPAKIFMGDTGALLLGFLLSAITVEGIMKSVATIAMAVPIMVLGVPIFDTAFAIVRRKISGKSITSADKGHLHHRLLAQGNSQKKTVLILYGISIFFGITAIIISTCNLKIGNILTLIVFALTIIFALKFGMFTMKEK